MEIQPNPMTDLETDGAAQSSQASALLTKPLVLVGLMGAGKTSVGRRIAALLTLSFVDSDEKIVEAAGMPIPDIFESYGEAAFRDVERRVIANIMDRPPSVIAFGGGAFMDDETRAMTKERAVSIWLRADIDILVQRVSRKQGTRPLLAKGDPKAILQDLSDRRAPVYGLADHIVQTGEQTAQQLAQDIVELMREHGIVR